MRIGNVQVRQNQNSGYQNARLDNGSKNIRDYTRALSDHRASWQRIWETEVGTTVQNDFETVTKHYVTDYLSLANRDILVTEDGSFVQRYVYDENGTRISAEFTHADGTARNTVNTDGENIASDIAVDDISKVWFRTSLLNSTLFTVDVDGEVISHTIYDPWGNPLTETYADTNKTGLDNQNNFTGYTWDETLELYFAQNRFYDPGTHRFTQEDIIKDGDNWYVYCANNPITYVDFWGLMTREQMMDAFNSYSTSRNIKNLLEKVFDLTKVERRSFLHRMTQVILATALSARGAYNIQFENHISSPKNGSGSIDVSAFYNGLLYAFEVKPADNNGKKSLGTQTLSEWHKNEAIIQLQKYYKILTCNGVAHANSVLQYTELLKLGNVYEGTIFRTPRQELKLTVMHTYPGIITYQANYTDHQDASKSNAYLTGLAFSWMYQRHLDQTKSLGRQVNTALDKALYSVTGKHLHDLTVEEAVAYGFAAGTVVAIGTAAAVWAIFTVGTSIPVAYSVEIGSAAVGGAKIIEFIITEGAQKVA